MSTPHQWTRCIVHELTNGDLNIELEYSPVPSDCTKFWLDNDAVLSAGNRAAERKETVKSLKFSLIGKTSRQQADRVTLRIGFYIMFMQLILLKSRISRMLTGRKWMMPGTPIQRLGCLSRLRMLQRCSQIPMRNFGMKPCESRRRLLTKWRFLSMI